MTFSVKAKWEKRTQLAHYSLKNLTSFCFLPFPENFVSTDNRKFGVFLWVQRWHRLDKIVILVSCGVMHAWRPKEETWRIRNGVVSWLCEDNQRKPSALHRLGCPSMRPFASFHPSQGANSSLLYHFSTQKIEEEKNWISCKWKHITYFIYRIL